MTPVVAIGGSLGGMDTLCEVLGQLPSNLPAAVLVVLHTSSKSGGRALSLLLQRCGSIPVKEAEDRESIHPGQVYLPPRNCHLLVQDDRLRTSRGPRENNCRPAIDPLFRTAAFYAREKCFGVILSGLLDDGSCGLQTIQQCGGRTLIQDPAEARSPDMPRNALRRVKPDYLLPAVELGAALLEALSKPAMQPPPIPSQLADEVLLTLRAMGVEGHDRDMEVNAKFGEQVPLSCPECGGSLWELGDSFRCHVGHAFSPEVLSFCQDRNLEQALWAAVRALEEKKKTLEKLLVRDPSGSQFSERATEAQTYADQIRQLLLRLARSD